MVLRDFESFVIKRNTSYWRKTVWSCEALWCYKKVDFTWWPAFNDLCFILVDLTFIILLKGESSDAKNLPYLWAYLWYCSLRSFCFCDYAAGIVAFVWSVESAVNRRTKFQSGWKVFWQVHFVNPLHGLTFLEMA